MNVLGDLVFFVGFTSFRMDGLFQAVYFTYLSIHSPDDYHGKPR